MYFPAADVSAAAAVDAAVPDDAASDAAGADDAGADDAAVPDELPHPARRDAAIAVQSNTLNNFFFIFFISSHIKKFVLPAVFGQAVSYDISTFCVGILNLFFFFLVLPDLITTSSRTDTITMMPITIFLIATGAPAN